MLRKRIKHKGRAQAPLPRRLRRRRRYREGRTIGSPFCIKIEPYLVRNDGREMTGSGGRSASLLPPCRRQGASLLAAAGFYPQAFDQEHVIADEPSDFWPRNDFLPESREAAAKEKGARRRPFRDAAAAQVSRLEKRTVVARAR